MFRIQATIASGAAAILLLCGGVLPAPESRRRPQ